VTALPVASSLCAAWGAGGCDALAAFFSVLERPDDHREIRHGALEHFADRLVAGMSDSTIYADAEGVIRLWNRGATRVFGFTETEALGRSRDIIIPEVLRERHWNGCRATTRTGQSHYIDGEILSVPALRKDGARVSVEFTIVTLTDDAGRMMGIAAILRDVTARFKELRVLRNAVRQRQNFHRSGARCRKPFGVTPARHFQAERHPGSAERDR
jgi:PAS domain S-box-containing protein